MFSTVYKEDTGKPDRQLDYCHHEIQVMWRTLVTPPQKIPSLAGDILPIVPVTGFAMPFFSPK